MLDGDLTRLESFSRSKRLNVLKSLIAFSKFLGCYESFKARIRNHGIRWQSQDSFSSFLRMANSGNGLREWIRECLRVLDDRGRLLLLLALASGLRKSECFKSFNLIIRLNREGRLSEYYNPSLQVLEHFRFEKLFIRRTKNVYISFIPRSLVDRIAASKPVSYPSIRNRLKKRGLGTRLNELRDHYATFMVQHGLIREEVDLLQGRIGKTIFMRNYFSPSLQDLGQRTIAAVNSLLEDLEIEL
jgi:hypothetical protein